MQYVVEKLKTYILIFKYIFLYIYKKIYFVEYEYKIFYTLPQRNQFFTFLESFSFGDLGLKVISKFEDFAIFIINASLTDVSAA